MNAGCCVLIKPNTSHPARCHWLGASHHRPKADAQKRPEHSKNKTSGPRAESLQIQTPPHTSSGSTVMIERDYFCMSQYIVSTHYAFKEKLSIFQPGLLATIVPIIDYRSCSLPCRDLGNMALEKQRTLG